MKAKFVVPFGITAMVGDPVDDDCSFLPHEANMNAARQIMSTPEMRGMIVLSWLNERKDIARHLLPGSPERVCLCVKRDCGKIKGF